MDLLPVDATSCPVLSLFALAMTVHLCTQLPLALKALNIGVPPSELLIDCAQAGGLHGRYKRAEIQT